MNSKRASTAAFGISVLALVGLYSSHELFSDSIVVIAIQVFAALLMAWARVTFGARSFHAAADPTPGGVVDTGPYRYVRHPIYAAAILFSWASVLSHVSALGILLRLAITAAMWTRALLEEPLLRARYPEYAEYASRTRRMIPFVS